MKKFLFIFTFLSFVNLYSQAVAPFYEPFEDNTFDDDPSIVGTNGFQLGANPNIPWEIDIDPSSTYTDNSLKIIVDPNDHPQGASYPKSRSEITYKLDNYQDEITYYSWYFYIPDDDDFSDEEITKGWHYINQILTQDPINTSQRKLLGMEYKHEEGVFSDWRDLTIRIYDSHIRNQVRSWVRISDAIEKGTWNHLIYHIVWSQDDVGGSNPGSYSFWINNKKVVGISNTPYYIDIDLNGDGEPDIEDYEVNDYNSVLSNTTSGVTSYQAPNIDLMNHDNIFKFGHYRGNEQDPLINTFVESHESYLDNFRITKLHPPIKNKTHLISKYCDKTLELGNMELQCYESEPSTNYKFRFKENGIIKYYINSSTPFVDLSYVDPNKTYDVDVSLQNGFIDYGYDRVCSITTPHLTRLKDEHCSTNVANNSKLYCYKISNATNYKFRFKDTHTNIYYYANTNSRDNWIDLSNYSFNTNRTYIVDVKAEGQNFNFNYDTACWITIVNGLQSPIENKELKESKINIYPNPFSDEISISNYTGMFKIYDVYGFSHKKGYIKDEASINTQSFNKGIYFIQFIREDEILTYQIVK